MPWSYSILVYICDISGASDGGWPGTGTMDWNVGGWGQTGGVAGKKPTAHGNEEPVSSAEALDGFSVATRAWFEGAFVVPTQAQAQAWRAIGWEGSGGREGSGGKGRQDVLVIGP